MGRIDIVTHCWSGGPVKIYHRLLRYQISSLIAAGHCADVKLSIGVNLFVCHSDSDRLTKRVVDWGEEHLSETGFVRLIKIPLSESHLFRRAIGRNLCAKASTADVVWFTDCDHYFGTGSIEQAHKFCRESQTPMIHPKKILINKTHLEGDEMIKFAASRTGGLVIVDPSKFKPKQMRRAIGGLQIVKGDWCRENGYLDGTKWVEPVDPSRGFRSCKGDVSFRARVGPSNPRPIENVYRIRHSRCGRDGGTVDHGRKTRS